jgi:hypothetical protein
VILTASLSLAGVALGAGGTLLGQYLTTRVTRAEAQATREAALRAERKAAIVEFLAAAQHIEHLCEKLWIARLPRNAEETALPTHRMWLLQKTIDLVAAN